MDLTLLRTAALVVQHGSFAGAARQMDMDPSSVSRSVAALEDQLGLRLFERSTRHLSLTEGGRIFLDRTAPLLEEFDRARDDALDARKAPRGPVRVAASVAFGQMCLMPLLSQMRAELPEIEPEFLLNDARVNLVDAGVDIAIRLAPAPTGDLISARLMHTRYHVCAAPSYITSRGRPLAPQDLVDHACLLYSLPEFRNVWRFRETTGAIHEQDVTGPIRISNPLSLREAARRGLGPALLADWLVHKDLSKGKLVDLFPDHAVTATTFDTGAWLLYPSRRYLPARTRAVIDFLKANLPLA